MTKRNLVEEMIVIAAGYWNELNSLLMMILNPGVLMMISNSGVRSVFHPIWFH